MDVFPTGTRVLDDPTYFLYGGWKGESTPPQRNLAYLTAEDRMERHIGTFLTPTTVTGTFPVTVDPRLVLPHTRVLRVDGVAILREPVGSDSQDYVRRAGIARAVDLDHGVVEVFETSSQPGTTSIPGAAKQIEIAYTAGLSDGVAASSSTMVHALVIVAEEALQQIVEPSASEGGPGAPGVQQYSMGRYSESRARIQPTTLGHTARAQFAANLVKSFQKLRARKIGQ